MLRRASSLRLPRLLRTGAARLALRYGLLYAVLASVGLVTLYWATSAYVDKQLRAGLQRELNDLVRLDRKRGSAALGDAIATRLRGQIRDDSQRFYLFLGKDGEHLAGRLRSWPGGIVADKRVRNVLLDDRVLPNPREDQDSYWPVIATRLADGSRLLVAQDVGQTEAMRQFILVMLFGILSVTLLLMAALGIFMGRGVLKRVDDINRTASAIRGGDLSQRIGTLGRGDEFDQLAEHLNAMLDRIDRLVASMREVTDNVAHDLRSPLTRLRNHLEVTLIESRSETEYREAMTRAVEDANDLIRTFNALLEIALAESGDPRSSWDSVELGDLLVNMTELYEPLAEERNLTLTTHLIPDARVTGSAHLLAQAIGNLIENAIKYTPSGGRVELVDMTTPDGVAVEVHDTGPGIPAADRERVLLRFVRLDRARGTPGNGLGLSLVKAVVELHGARLLLTDNQPGLRVRIEFPPPREST